MKKIWLLAITTYKQRVRSSAFLILTFALPVLMVIAGAIPVILLTREAPDQTVGYVDQTGSLAQVSQVSMEDATLSLREFNSTQSAREAFQGDEIEGYLVIPEGYFEGEPTQFYAEEEPNESLQSGLSSFMRRAMLPDAPDWVFERLEDPSNRVFVALESGETLPEGIGFVIHFATPAVLSILLGLALLFTSSQMGAAVVREKDQRSLEIVITSLKPRQLVLGKVLGIALLSASQLAVWGIGGAIGLTLALWGRVNLQDLSIRWDALLWALLLGIPGYLLYAVLSAGLGIIAGDTQQAQQLSGMLGFLGLFPLWFAGLLIEAPNSTLALALSLFPLTGPIFTLLRMTVTTIPLWQLLATLSLVALSLAAGVWVVARIFRASMLLYGKEMRPGLILQAIREA